MSSGFIFKSPSSQPVPVGWFSSLFTSFAGVWLGDSLRVDWSLSWHVWACACFVCRCVFMWKENSEVKWKKGKAEEEKMKPFPMPIIIPLPSPWPCPSVLSSPHLHWSSGSSASSPSLQVTGWEVFWEQTDPCQSNSRKEHMQHVSGSCRMEEKRESQEVEGKEEQRNNQKYIGKDQGWFAWSRMTG